MYGARRPSTSRRRKTAAAALPRMPCSDCDGTSPGDNDEDEDEDVAPGVLVLSLAASVSRRICAHAAANSSLLRNPAAASTSYLRLKAATKRARSTCPAPGSVGDTSLGPPPPALPLPAADERAERLGMRATRPDDEDASMRKKRFGDEEAGAGGVALDAGVKFEVAALASSAPKAALSLRVGSEGEEGEEKDEDEEPGPGRGDEGDRERTDADEVDAARPPLVSSPVAAAAARLWAVAMADGPPTPTPAPGPAGDTSSRKAAMDDAALETRSASVATGCSAGDTEERGYARVCVVDAAEDSGRKPPPPPPPSPLPKPAMGETRDSPARVLIASPCALRLGPSLAVSWMGMPTSAAAHSAMMGSSLSTSPRGIPGEDEGMDRRRSALSTPAARHTSSATSPTLALGAYVPVRDPPGHSTTTVRFPSTERAEGERRGEKGRGGGC